MKIFVSCVVAIAILLSNHSTATVYAGVNGDNNIDAYVGTGGLLLPSSFTGSASKAKSVASCLGCTWKYSIYCALDNADLCAHAITTCPVGQIRYRVWFGTTPDNVTVIGSVCWGSDKPPTRKTLEALVDDLAIRYVPMLRPAIQPSGGTITSIPIIARTSQPRTYKPPAMRLGGRTVSITATAHWHWTWGDGKAEWKAVPGAAYPSTQITHQFRAVGNYEVQVQTVWTATYTVFGLGTFPVAGEVITQEARLQVPVRTAATALVPWE